jgi:hypothetical protein
MIGTQFLYNLNYNKQKLIFQYFNYQLIPKKTLLTDKKIKKDNSVHLQIPDLCNQIFYFSVRNHVVRQNYTQIKQKSWVIFLKKCSKGSSGC